MFPRAKGPGSKHARIIRQHVETVGTQEVRQEVEVAQHRRSTIVTLRRGSEAGRPHQDEEAEGPVARRRRTKCGG